MVKVGPATAGAPPFLQAVTANEWVVTLRFLVKRGDFNPITLARQLDLAPFYESARPVLSNAERLAFTPARGGVEEILITAHSAADLATDAFDAFLVRAAVSYQKAFDGKPRLVSAESLADAAAIAAEGVPPGWRVITAATEASPRPKRRRPKV